MAPIPGRDQAVIHARSKGPAPHRAGAAILAILMAAAVFGPCPSHAASIDLGDGGAATAARLAMPMGLAVDPAGTVYVADSQDRAVRAIAPDGAITTIAGMPALAPGADGFNGPANQARLNRPVGLIWTSAGLILTDAGNHVVDRIAPDGTLSVIAGQPGQAGFGGDGDVATAALLSAPSALALDGGGNLYVADTGNNAIRRIDAAGGITTVAGNPALGPGYSGDGAAAIAAQLNGPLGLVVLANGALIIADTGNGVLRQVTPVDPANPPADNQPVITTLAGTTPGYDGDGGPAISARFQAPAGLAADDAGNLLIADSGNNVIRLIDSTGVVSTLVGNRDLGPGYSGDGGAASLAQLSSPEALALTADALLIGDCGNSAVRRVGLDLMIATLAGRGVTGPACDPARGFFLQSGFWGDPAQPGGLTLALDVTPVGGLRLAILGFDDSGFSHWWLSSGALASVASYAGQLTDYAYGAPLGYAYRAPVGSAAGAIGLRFTAADGAVVTLPTGAQRTIRRLGQGADGSVLPQPRLQAITGFWADAGHPDRLVFIEGQGDRARVAALSFDRDGGGLWFGAGGAQTSQSLFQGAWTELAGGQTLSGPYRAPAVISRPALGSIQFATPASGTWTFGATAITLVRAEP